MRWQCQHGHGGSTPFVYDLHRWQEGRVFRGGLVGAHGVQRGLQGGVGHVHLGAPEAAVAARQAGAFGADVQGIGSGVGHGQVVRSMAAQHQRAMGDKR